MSYEITLTNLMDGQPFKFDARAAAQLQQYGIYTAEQSEGKTDEEISSLEPVRFATLVTLNCGCEFMAVEDVDVVHAMIEKAGRVVS